MTPSQRAVLERMSTGELIISTPGGFHVPYAPPRWEGTEEKVNNRVLQNLRLAGYVDSQGDSIGTCSHEITEAGRRALASE